MALTPPPEIHVAGRGGGKTTNMLVWMAQHPNAYLLSHDTHAAMRAHDMAVRLGFGEAIDMRRFLGPADIDRLRGKSDPMIGIDNLDLFLLNYLNLPRTPARMTITGRAPERVWHHG